MHAADVASTLPSCIRREESSSRGIFREKSASDFAARVFVSRLLRVAAAAVQSDAEARRRFPTLERALLVAAKRRATEIGSDARAEKAEVERLRRCTFDAWLVARATGVA